MAQRRDYRTRAEIEHARRRAGLEPEPISGRAAALIAIGILATLIVLCLMSAYIARAHAHEIYADWTRKGCNVCSCCSGDETSGDCYATTARFDPVSGTWFARRREDGRWLEIPKTVYDPTADEDGVRQAPQDGRAHLCAYPPKNSGWPNKDGILCFTPGTGT